MILRSATTIGTLIFARSIAARAVALSTPSIAPRFGSRMVRKISMPITTPGTPIA